MRNQRVTIQTQMGGSNVTVPAQANTASRPRFETKDHEDPVVLNRKLTELAAYVDKQAGPGATNPVNTGTIIQNLTFTAGQTQNILHGLGRAPIGWFCVRAQTNPAVLVEVATPSGVDRTTTLSITSSNAGTYDLYVF